MKYKDVKDGQIFFIEDSFSYPKLKIGYGHRDLRDNCFNSHGNPDWDVTLIDYFPTLRSQLVECEKVADAMKAILEPAMDEGILDFGVVYKIIQAYEAYKSAHPTEKE